MSTNLKVLALASAAMLAVPAAGHAANLDIVGNDLGGWTRGGVGFHQCYDQRGHADVYRPGPFCFGELRHDIQLLCRRR